MKLKISLIGILFLTLHSFAQQASDYKGVYVSIGYEMGLSLNSENTETLKSSKAKNRWQYAIPVSVSYRTEIGLDVELGYFPSQNIIRLKENNAKISYFSHTAFGSVGYHIPITEFIDIRAGIGGSITFIGDINDNSKDNPLAITQGRSSHIVIPLSAIKHFRNGNQLVFGAKYYHSLRDDFIKGSDGSKVTLNSSVALYVSYGFKIKLGTENCGCLF